MPLHGLIHQDFVALDFETATTDRNSACAVALVKVQNDGIVHRAFRLIRPPTSEFRFTHIHGITWADVRHEPTFEEIWPELVQLTDGAFFYAAHNAAFDRSVLHACCKTYNLSVPQTPFVCTMQLARRCWRLRPTRLPDVCRYLGIDLQHHDAASDAEACARIVLAARRDAL
ncbi:3'-5' exonuclease [Desulfosoma caldarium]|uniref:DNA polymerase-3 subunit epsilon n=1 Tax=Desulfosoma caldarium TaxID=610254 RepID=A0A3N1VFZ3_9BACT|nr:3'-5' exonuclease [Desulfosoma caldarium]ROR01766.1 DNA polymerase-3 subunit epsilon [Desulfosoma caldarium]